MAKNLIPHFIDENYRNGIHQGEIQSFCMLVDLSGFTSLTGSLMEKGDEGVEELSNILNEIFAPLVELVYAWNGFIPYFAGDSFTAIFPMSDYTPASLENLVVAAIQMRQKFSSKTNFFGEFNIGIKIGVAYGPIHWGIVGTEMKTFYFKGDPIDAAAKGQSLASNLEIIIPKDFAELLESNSSLLIIRKKDLHFCIPSEVITHIPFPPKKELPKVTKPSLEVFLPASMLDRSLVGEFRDVISVFISFEGIETHETLDKFSSLLMEQVQNFSGYLKEIEFGDKGGVVVVLFGAPVTFENNVERALEFILAVRDTLKINEETWLWKFRVGMTQGMAYTGLIGGFERCQYGAVGNRVNLAARLMSHANWNEVLTGEEIQKDNRYEFAYKGNIHLKGIQGSTPTYELIGKRFQQLVVYHGAMVGRDREFFDLCNFARPLLDGRPTGIAYLYGEAGIGKSRLGYELKRFLGDKVNWYLGQCDQILKKSFNPFIYFLKNYFLQSADHDDSTNEGNFETIFQKLIVALEATEGHEPYDLRRELNRTKPVLAALVGLRKKDTIWEQLDAKGRYQNTLWSIVNLISAESLLKPLVLELEDTHWIDENSKELLHELLRSLYRRPILVLVTSRFKDDGSRPVLFDEHAFQHLNIPTFVLDLNMLQPESVKKLAETFLAGVISGEFAQRLLQASNSNPFYLEQLLEYFSEHEVLIKNEDDEWEIKEKDVKVTGSINAILTARIDRLESMVQETVKAASVIGREFEVPILAEVMKNQKDIFNDAEEVTIQLREQIKNAEKVQIWHAINELRYIFHHSLLREAVYNMQLKARLMQLHQLIAESIEKLYSDKLDEHFYELAFHYEEAGVHDKTCEYLRKSADFARRNYQNHRALEYYEKLLEKIGNDDNLSRQSKTRMKKGKILELIGNWEESEVTLGEALEMAKSTRDVLLIGQAYNNLGHLLMLKGKYMEAKSNLQTAAGLFESIEDKAGTSKVYGDLGNLFFRQGDYEAAKNYFTRSLDLSREQQITIDAHIVGNLGLIYMNQGDFAAAIQCLEEQLATCERIKDKQGMATVHTHIGIVYFEMGHYDDSMESYLKGLALSEELGNKQLTAIATGGLGAIFEKQGNYQEAMSYFVRDLNICEELGDKQGIAIALGLIGELLSYMGDFFKAIEYLQKNLMLCEELGYQKGIAKSVNTLGDVFFFTSQFDRSLYYYNRAIEVTRRISNKLVLGSSLVEKAEVLIVLKRLSEVTPVRDEALTIAKELGNPDLLFDAQILNAKTMMVYNELEKATELLLTLLKEEPTLSQKGEVYYELWRVLPEHKEYKLLALECYEELYAKTPKYLYKHRIEKLKEA